MTDKPTPLVIAATLPIKAAHDIYDWTSRLRWPEGTKLKSWRRYHITLLYCPSDVSPGPNAEDNRHWAAQYADRRMWLNVRELATFTPVGGAELLPIVLGVDGSIDRLADLLY